jgi:hypothetical protein
METAKRVDLKDSAMTDKPRVPRKQWEVLSWEDIADFNLFSNTILARLAPVGAMEGLLAERVVSLSWRIKRAEYIQKAALEYLKVKEAGKMKAAEKNGRPRDNPILSDDDAILARIMEDPSNVKALEGLLRYEQRLEDSLRKTRKELERFQRLRRPKKGRKSSAPEDPMADWPTPDEFPDLSSPQ